jgi:hypothetical protein
VGLPCLDVDDRTDFYRLLDRQVTALASIRLLLALLVRGDRLWAGQFAMLIGFGASYTMGSALLEFGGEALTDSARPGLAAELRVAISLREHERGEYCGVSHTRAVAVRHDTRVRHRRTLLAAAFLDVARVDAGEGQADAHLASTRRRLRNLAHHQHIARWPSLFVPGRLHRGLSLGGADGVGGIDHADQLAEDALCSRSAWALGMSSSV